MGGLPKPPQSGCRTKDFHFMKCGLGVRRPYNVAGAPSHLFIRTVQHGPPTSSAVLANSLPSVIARTLDDGSAQVQRFQYNSKGKPTLTVDPLNRTNQFTYAANGIDLIETRHVVGATTELLGAVSYNSQHLPLRATNAAGKVTSFGYNAYGQLTSLTNAKGETVTMSYDGNGFLTNVVGSLPNSKVSFTYDSTNHVRTVTDSQGYTITNSYDNLDRLIRVEYPDGTSEVTVYDKLDATMVKNRRNQWSRTIYDATRQPIVTADALGRLTYFDWCACGSLGSITDPMGRVTSWVRDIQGRVQSKYYPDLTHVDYAYETKSGRLKSITDAKNQTKAFTYNTDNTLRQITYSNAVVATPSVSFTYDTNYVRVLTMTDGIGTTTYSYNPINGSLGAGMLASIDGPLSNDTITYRYDELGRVTNQAINNVGVNVTYDSIGRVTVMTNALGTFTNTYDTNTLMLTSVAYPNGQSMNLSYFGNDHDRRLQTIWNKKGDGTTISKFDYTYDSDGQIQTWQQELGGVSTNIYNFTYDPVDQLLHGSLSNAVTGALIKQFFYQYDTAGNRTAEQIDMASASASFNNLNQMTSRTNGGAIQFKGSLNEGGTVNVAGKAAIMLTSNRFVGYGVATNGTNPVVLSATDYSSNTTNKTYQIVVTNNTVTKTLSYDLNGNLTNEVSATQTNTYEWDAADRMVARTSATNRSEFTYDGMSRCVRIVEKTNGVVASDKRFVWCGMRRCEERDSTGGTVTKRFFGAGEQISGANYYFTVDHLGSIREMSDTSGVVRARYDYDPYGRRTKPAGDLEADFGSTGHYLHQASGLYFAPLRSYDPDSARWLSRDPIQEGGGINLYAYVGNNPVNKVDPDGRLAWVPFLIAAFVWGAVMAEETANAPAPGDPTYGPLTVGDRVLAGTVNMVCGGALRGAGVLTSKAAGALKGCPTTPPEMVGGGKGIVYDGEVVAHAPLEAVTSHEQLAIRSGTLLQPPKAGTPGLLIEGAEAFTYVANGSKVLVTGSMNFNMTVSVNTVEVVTFYVNGRK